MKLSLEARNHAGVMIVHSHGRIVYRDEAAAFSQVVGEMLQHHGRVIVDLGEVHSIDSAGIGEMVLLHTSANAKNADLKWANPSPVVQRLLSLTHLDSFLEIHSSLGEAMEALKDREVCADC